MAMLYGYCTTVVTTVPPAKMPPLITDRSSDRRGPFGTVAIKSDIVTRRNSSVHAHYRIRGSSSKVYEVIQTGHGRRIRHRRVGVLFQRRLVCVAHNFINREIRTGRGRGLEEC